MVIATIVTILVSFFYPIPLVCDFPLVWHAFHDNVIFVLCLYSTYERKRGFWPSEPF
jgi:hypothetical protein